MSDTVIKVENLGKQYTLGKELKTANSFGGRIKQLAALPFGWLSQQIKGPDPDQILWALKDVSFEVKRGEVIGIIGRNGAGKSTLLKILSRITEPTEGFAEIKGRVGSLLEVGTGMHPELTGRENIYMNATVLGMTKREVDAKFDEIVDFSGIEKFLDTPVKRYSSGMRVRLGFAIAAHLEPEILIIDEVLAVGDAEFQKKAIRKMKNVSEDLGRTVLFVSHNMGSIRNLCSSVITFEQGQIDFQGNTAEAITRYLQEDMSKINTCLKDRVERVGSGELRFTSYNLETIEGKRIDSVFSGMEFKIKLEYQSFSTLNEIQIALLVKAPDGTTLFVAHTYYSLNSTLSITENGSIACKFKKIPLPPETYTIDIWAGSGHSPIDYIKNAFTLEVQNGDYYGSGKLTNLSQGLLIEHSWAYEK